MAIDHAQLQLVRAVAPVIEEARRSVDVDPRRRRVALEPAQPLERDGELARTERRPAVKHGDRVAAEHAVRLQPVIRLQLLHRRDQRARIAYGWPSIRRRRGEIAVVDERGRDEGKARIAAAGFERLAGGDLRPLRLRHAMEGRDISV